jgi:CBS domain-containing protein
VPGCGIGGMLRLMLVPPGEETEMEKQSEKTGRFGFNHPLGGFVGPQSSGRDAGFSRSDALSGRMDRQPRDDDEDRLAAESRMEDEGGPPAVSAVSVEEQQRPKRERSIRRSGSSSTRSGRGLIVADVMTKSVRAVALETTIKEVALMMAGDAIGVVPVVDDDNVLVGLITDRDIVIRVCAGDKGVDDLRASDAMTPNPTGIRSSETITNALAVMARLQVHRLPVVDEGFRLIGMLSIGDIASRGDASADLREALAEISNRRSFWSRIWR